MRSVAALEPAPKRMRVEGEEEGEREQGLAVVRNQRQSALRDVFEKVKRTFESWRMGGQYVNNEDLSAKVQ